MRPLQRYSFQHRFLPFHSITQLAESHPPKAFATVYSLRQHAALTSKKGASKSQFLPADCPYKRYYQTLYQMRTASCAGMQCPQS